MINTGLIMRRPYESEYAAFRRFLVANRFENRTSLKAELEPYGDGMADTPGKPWLAPRARKFEMEFCKAKGIPWQNPAPINEREALRNCPTCAAQCYHSALYQYQWVKTCPLHQQDIVTSCPSCKKPWPQPSELLKRDCPDCSANVPMGRLSEIQRLSDCADTRYFETVSSIVSQWQSQNNIRIYAANSYVNLYGEHHCVGPEQPHWPSLVAYGKPEWQDAFEAFGARSTVYERVFDPGPIDSQTKSPNRVYEGFLENLLFRRFEISLRAKLRHRFGNEAADGADNFYFADKYSMGQVVHFCLLNWRVVVSEGRKYRRQLPHLAAGALFMNRDIAPPLSPCLMTHVDEKVSPNPEAFSLSEDFHARQLPRQLQAWLYLCDLSWTFWTMLRYLDAVAAGINRGWGWSKILSALPSEALPEAWNHPRYFVGKNNDNLLVIRVPEWVNYPSFDDLQLESLK